MALIEEMRRRVIIIPGISVVERLAARAMYVADRTAVRLIAIRSTPSNGRAWMHC
jgi:hypothetical protein